jgi:hypothetical protein
MEVLMSGMGATTKAKLMQLLGVTHPVRSTLEEERNEHNATANKMDRGEHTDSELVEEEVMDGSVEEKSGENIQSVRDEMKRAKRRLSYQRKKKSQKGNDTNLTVFVNDKLIRYCKYYEEGRDSSSDAEMAMFVKESYFQKRFSEKVNFQEWWSTTKIDVKTRIKTKRVNMMGTMSRVFKGK